MLLGIWLSDDMQGVSPKEVMELLLLTQVRSCCSIS